MEQLLKMLENHDWYFHYSDDHRVWSAGNEQWKAIRELAEELGPEAQALLKSWQDKKYAS